jgi:hypothetical protein
MSVTIEPIEIEWGSEFGATVYFEYHDFETHYGYIVEIVFANPIFNWFWFHEIPEIDPEVIKAEAVEVHKSIVEMLQRIKEFYTNASK